MTRFSHGALIINDFPAGLSRTLRFQYNPVSVTRSLKPRTIGGGSGDQSPSTHFAGPPTESFSLELFLDATDGSDPGLDEGPGLLPELDAFELILYPKSVGTIANAALAMAGIIEVLPHHAPAVVLVLGRDRTLPVRITALSIAEELHNRAMNPIRARVTLSVEVVSTSDVSAFHPDHGRFLRYQITKEVRSLEAYERLGPSIWGRGGLD